MGIEYIVRRARSEDIDAMLSLIRQCLGDSTLPRNAEYWRWKHVRNPFGASPCLVAEADGRLIGLRAFMRWTWDHAGRDVKSVRAVDTATHPDWRGRGIFKTLTLQLVAEMKDEGVNLVFNTPNGYSRPGYLKMGWTSIGRSAMWVKAAHPTRIARALFTGTRLAGSGREPIPDGMAAFPPVNALVDHAEFRSLVGSMRAGDHRLRVEPTVAYVRWRYADIPGIAYRVAYRFDGRDCAAVVFGVTRNRGLLALRICDMLIAPTRGSHSLARMLVRHLLAAPGCDYAVAIAGWGTPEASILLRCGFIPVPRSGPVMVVRPLDASVLDVDPLRRSSWRLSIGTLELF